MAAVRRFITKPMMQARPITQKIRLAVGVEGGDENVLGEPEALVIIDNDLDSNTFRERSSMFS
jgi:hypothetical protein